MTALAAEMVEAIQSTAMTEVVQAIEPCATDEPAHHKVARYVWALFLAALPPTCVAIFAFLAL